MFGTEPADHSKQASRGRYAPVYAYFLLLLAGLWGLLCPVMGATTLGANVNLIPETGITWTTQQALTLVSTITISSNTLTMDSVGILVERGGETMTGKLYDSWTTSNMTWALNGTGAKTVMITGLDSEYTYHFYRDGLLANSLSTTAGVTSLNVSCDLGSEHVFQLIRGAGGLSGPSDPGGGGGTGGDDEEEDDGEDGEEGDDTPVIDETEPPVTSKWHPTEPTVLPGEPVIKTNWYAVGVAFAVPYIYFKYLKKKR